MFIILNEIQHVLSHSIFKSSFVVNLQLGITATEEFCPFVLYFERVEAFVDLLLGNRGEILYQLAVLESFGDFATVLKNSIIYFCSIVCRFWYVAY